MTVTALDDYTVECVLPLPFASFLRSMGTSIYPRHILEQHVDDGTFAATWGIETDPTEVIGTSPFTIASYLPGERVVMQRNADYWLKDDAATACRISIRSSITLFQMWRRNLRSFWRARQTYMAC